MSAPSVAEAPPFRRLRQILTRDVIPENVREAAGVAMSVDFERAALTPGWRMQDRLAAVSGLARLVHDSPLPPRERDIVLFELARLALRVLWWEGLLGPGMAPEQPGDVAAAVLIELLASGALPEGPAALMVLERAKALLQRGDVILALRQNAPRRDRLLQQLVAAEARLQPLRV